MSWDTQRRDLRIQARVRFLAFVWKLGVHELELCRLGVTLLRKRWVGVN